MDLYRVIARCAIYTVPGTAPVPPGEEVSLPLATAREYVKRGLATLPIGVSFPPELIKATQKFATFGESSETSQRLII